MGFSSLIAGTVLTNNCTVPRNHAIDTQTPHYMAGYATGAQCAKSFVPAARRASANYCLGYLPNDIIGNVDEKNRAWTTGSSLNDHRAITFECANMSGGALTNATWNSLVRLSADICKRYGKRKLVYTGRASWNSLKSDEMLLTKHKWFQNTDCPGNWLDSRFGLLADTINKILADGKIPTPIRSFGGMYRCNVAVLNVRESPNVYSSVVAEYHRGDIVMLDDWYISANGYIWGKYTADKSGKTRYVAVGKDTGKVEADDYLIRIG